MANDKLITLITGGNSGIGFSLASLLIADPARHVIITSRNGEKGEAALKQLQDMKLPGGLEMLQVQLADPKSIEALAKQIGDKYGRLDALVNNAAQAVATEGTSLFDHMQQCFAANVSGPAVLIEAAVPLLLKSVTTPRIINVSSGAGSLGLITDPTRKNTILAIPYRASKAGLNMMSCVEVAKFQEAGHGIKLFTYCPGFCVSNLGPHNNLEGGAKPTVEGAQPMVPILNGERDEMHGQFLNSEGGTWPW